MALQGRSIPDSGKQNAKVLRRENVWLRTGEVIGKK
jgi:hypothetical protein